jgi:hypothetical protein
MSKMKCGYPAAVLEDGRRIEFPDFPEIAGALPDGADVEKAAKTMLEAAIAERMEKRQKVPFPSMPRDGDRLVWTSRKLGHNLTGYWDGVFVPPPAKRRVPRKQPGA